MTYIKTYEYFKKNGKKLYWLIPTDDRLESAMKKIGCSKNYILNSEFIKKRYKYIFIAYDGESRTKLAANRWDWQPYESEFFNTYLNNNNYKFIEMVNIPDYEIASQKYNI